MAFSIDSSSRIGYGVGSSGLSFNSQFLKLSSPIRHISLTPKISPRKIEVYAAGNTFGTHFRVTTFGESHGNGVGCTIDGCPPRIPISEADLQVDLDRRGANSQKECALAPSDALLKEARSESNNYPEKRDRYMQNTFWSKKWLVFNPFPYRVFAMNGLTTGTPIGVIVPNTDQRGHDYTDLAFAYRPSHADATYDFKYGLRDVQGGGRSSARETIGRVAAGAVAKAILRAFSKTEVLAYVSQVHKVILPEGVVDHETLTLNQIESNIIRCPDPEYAEKMIADVDAIRVKGDSIGGVVTCIARNVPRGLGSPIFDKLEAELAKAVLSLPATKGFEFGSGFAGTFLTGSEHNDEFYIDEHGKIRTKTNRSGGIQGGISNGEIIYMRVAFKPTATIGKKQLTVTRDGQEIELLTRGRHDPCVVPRAVPMVEAMVALVLVDQLIAHHGQCRLFPANPDLQ